MPVRPSIVHRRRRLLLGGEGGEPPEPGVDVLAGFEWRTATGTTEAAFRDTSNAIAPWDAYNGVLGNGAAEIVAPDAGLTGRGNYFRVFNDGEDNLTVTTEDLVPAVTTHWGRVYFRNNKTVGSHNHPIAIGGLSDPPSNIITVPLVVTGTGSGTTYQAQTLMDVGGAGSGYRRVRWTPGQQGVAGYDYLTDDQWYLLEWGVTWLTSTRYNLSVWIHEVDAAGDIVTEDLYTSATLFWEDYFGGADSNLASTQAAESDLYGFTTGDLTGQYVFGNEGPAGGSTNGEYFDMASFGISTEGRLRDQSLGLA